MRRLCRRRQAFLLFEAMLAVAIFALGVLALGRCVDNCLRAEMLLQDDDRARRALENRMAEIEAGAVTVAEPEVVQLREPFAGMKLRQSREEMELKNENDELVNGISRVDLELSWTSRGEPRTRTLQFYVMPRTR